MELKEEIEKRRKNGWIEAWFAIEAVGVEAKVVEGAIKTHVEKIKKAPDSFVYEDSFKEVKDIGKPPEGFPGDTAWSQVAEVKLFVKDITTLFGLIVVYGPSSVEIIGPSKKEVKIDEIQSAANMLGSILHEFAARGLGGILVSAEPTKEK